MTRNVPVIVVADVPEAVIQLDIMESKGDQPLAMEITFGWTILGSSQKSSLTRKKLVKQQ